MCIKVKISFKKALRCYNIVKFFDVYCDVEPKRRALDEANAELLAARQKLTAVKNKVS